MQKFFCVVLFLLMYSLGYGQNQNELRVFLDCNRCDKDFIKEKIDYVSFVRDRNDAHVQIQINRNRTGSGGREFTVTFLGYNSFVGKNDTLIFSTLPNESDDNERKKLVSYIQIGLVSYLAKTSLSENIQISYNYEGSKKNNNIDDWDYWIFRTRVRGWINGEQSTSNFNLWGSLSANRITEYSKLRFRFSSSYNQRDYDYDGDKYRSISREQGLGTDIIQAINENWSYAFFGNIRSSIYDNMKFSSWVSPAIEYNFFPYSESTRKQFRINYRIGFGYNNYNEETIYFKQNEFLVNERLTLALDLIQPWGNIETEFLVSHYMHDISLNFLELRTEFRINVLTGLSIDLDGRLAYIHDQIALPRAGIDLEEVLLQQKELETNYQYWVRFGFTYSFGSIYNTIVNTRFGN